MSNMDTSVRISMAGAGLLLIAAILVPIADSENLMTGIVLGVIAIGLGVWIWRTESRAAAIASLILGGLLVLAFGLFVLGSASEDPIDGLVLAGDLAAAIAGVCFVVGAVMALRAKPAATTA
jgi:hypothetical protein